jgi:ubiquinone/menaquinone biosynthesis C-methylase UbiE
LEELLKSADNLQYSGIDISELMKQEAEKYSMENGLDKKANFQLYDGTNIPFADNSFHKIFTVNTIYFWQQPVELLNELNRVLKPDGILCITLVDEESMSRLPFTEYGFTKYNEIKFRDLADRSEIKLVQTTGHSEMITSKLLGEMERKFWTMELVKGTMGYSRPIF